MATPAAGMTANASFFFNQLADASLKQAVRLTATIGSFSYLQRTADEFATDPCGFAEAVIRAAPRLPELAPVRTYQIVVPQEIRGDAQATKEFLAAKQKEIDGEIPGGLSITPEEVSQVDGALTDFLSKLIAEPQGGTLTKAASSFHLVFHKIEKEDAFVDALSSPPLPTSKEEKVPFIRAQMTTNLKIGADEETLIAGCKNAEEIANRVIPFLIATIKASPLVSRATEGRDKIALAKERIEYIRQVVGRAIQHLAMMTLQTNV